MPFAHHSVPALEADTPMVFAVRAIEYTVSGPASVFVIVQAVKLVARYAPLAPTAVLVLSTHCRFAGGCGGDGGGLGG